MAVFLFMALVVVQISSGTPGGADARGVFGGPSYAEASLQLAAGMALVGQSPIADPGFRSDYYYGKDIAAGIFEGSVRDGGTPLSSSIVQGGVLTYKVKRGDSLSQIAADFGISVQTIIGSNPQVRSGSLQVDQELTILPVSGVLYQIKEGETPESVAAAFNLTVQQLQEFNRSANFGAFGPGLTLVIPGASPLAVARLDREYAKLPDLRDYFVFPAEGFNWGKLHPQNAVDIANNCGTVIHASAEGLVVDDSGGDYWSYGYGNYVFIEHPNGTKTRYSHLNKIGVSLGDYVRQGQEIGTMGNTGNVHGPTGCHLHFEVYGAKNPFAR